MELPEKIDQDLLDKLKALSDLESQLYEDSETIYRINKQTYNSALIQYKENLTMEVIANLIAEDYDNLGKNLFKLYKDFEGKIRGSHEKLQEVKDLFADCIDFKGLELDRYAEGGQRGYREKLYLRSTPEEEIRDLVQSGPDILEQIKVEFTEYGIWEAYLLFAAGDWMKLSWHEMATANDIVCPDCWKPIPPQSWTNDKKSELPDPIIADGYRIPYPVVVIIGNDAYIHYLCHFQEYNTYVDIYVAVERCGESLSFKLFYKDNTSIKGGFEGNNNIYY